MEGALALRIVLITLAKIPNAMYWYSSGARPKASRSLDRDEISSPALDREDLSREISRLGFSRRCHPEETLGSETKPVPARMELLREGELSADNPLLTLLGAVLSKERLTVNL